MQKKFIFMIIFIIILVFVSMIFVWARNKKVDSIVSDSKVTVNNINKGFYDIYPYEKLKEKTFVPNAETALELAKIYLGYKKLEAYPRYEINFLEKDEVWWIAFMSKEIKAGGDLNIAIQKKDGKVISIWAGE